MNIQTTLSDQLREIRPAIRGGRPYISKVFELTAELSTDVTDDPVKTAREQVLRWIQRRSGRLPKQAWEFESFALDQAVAPATVVALKTDHDIWAARLDDPDKTMPGRSWTTEVMVAKTRSGDALFGARLLVSERGGEFEFSPSTPGLVKQVIETPGLIDAGHRLSVAPWVVGSGTDVDRLIGLIESRDRGLPIFLITLPDGSAGIGDAVLDPVELAERTVGTAHVVVLPHEHTFQLTDHLGKQFSAFGGAVRTYRPGFDPSEDRPFRHPMAFRSRIESWGERGPAEFQELLVESAYRHSASKPNSEDLLPRFSTVRSHVTNMRRVKADADDNLAEQLELANIQIDELQQDKGEWEELARSEEREREEAENHVGSLRQERHRLLARITLLASQIVSVSGEQVDSGLELPDSLDSLQEWADANLAGRLVVTGRASRAAKGANFADVDLAYKAVLLLANEYRDSKLGIDESSHEKFQSACRELGLTCSQTFTANRAGEQGDEYFIKWNRKKQGLDLHLKNGGNTRDPARCFRLYFFWDEVDQQVVIGSMPGHLKIRLT